MQALPLLSIMRRLPYRSNVGAQYRVENSLKLLKISGLKIVSRLKTSTGQASIGVPEIKMQRFESVRIGSSF